MDYVTVVQRLMQRHPLPLWAVVLIALVLAWLHHAQKLRRMGPYDGWWFNNLRRSDLKFLHRPRRP